MTLESWSMGIVRPVMEVFPWAWAFFVPFILSTAFTVLNLFIGVIVSAMSEDLEASASRQREALHDEQAALGEEIRALRRDVADIKALVARAPVR
jgi:voltage-gated sodium channel